MKTILYYFTGTGNSLRAARTLQKNLDNCELKPIAGLLLSGKTTAAEKDANIGFVFPMYCAGVPNIVVRFFNQINLKDAGYVFSVITCGSSVQGSPVKPMAALCEKAGHLLNASWFVQMPSNYIPKCDCPSADKQKEIFDAAENKLAAIADSIASRENKSDKHTIAGKLMYLTAYKPFMKKIPDFDKKFVVSSHCNSCMVCVKICPVNNITADEDNNLQWTHHCEACLACLQFCPKGAISYDESDKSRSRYHNPSITVKDLINQKKTE
ncbi:MAG TPA: EFR1 family ferrodoxin [Methanocorpusculum sp.]|nr:EFR1 family ferrodoxin [Methanocorpusculum sp.]